MKQKRMTWVIVLCMVLCMGLAGCSGYASSFRATVLITTNTASSASVEFSTLTGTKVQQMKTKEDGATLEYGGKLVEGSMTVYYDEDGTKKELFTVKGGENKEGSVVIEKKGKLYLNLETDGKCESGKFTFEIK